MDLALRFDAVEFLPFCANRLPASCIRSLPSSLGNAGRFLQQNCVCCPAQAQATLAESMPDDRPTYLSWLSYELSEADDFGGWSIIHRSDSALLTGFLHLRAGIVLAMSFALASYLAFSTTGPFDLGGSKVMREAQPDISSTAVSTVCKEESETQKLMVINEEENNRVDSMSDVQDKSFNKIGFPAVALKLVIPGWKEPTHDRALLTLQNLKIVEPSCQSIHLCTRREYARWLVMASNILARKPSERIFPAVNIEGDKNLAFDDILPEDPDFPYIQGIAEAGLIASKLSSRDTNDKKLITLEHDINKAAFFLPDSCICRQDVVVWKASFWLEI